MKNINDLIRQETGFETEVEIVMVTDPIVPQEKQTLYKNQDFEVYISESGKVSASQSSMARMLGLKQGHLSSVLNRQEYKATSSRVEVETANGNKTLVSLYGVETILAMAVKYSPELAEKFGEMGATVYLYQQAGYKVNVNPKVSEPPKESSKSTASEYNDYLETAHKALGKLINLHRFAEDKPGLEAYLRLAEATGSKSLGGKMTLDAMAESFNVQLEPEHSRLIGRAMAGVSRSQEEEEPTKIRKRTKSEAGTHQSYWVTEYSIDFLPLFESLCRAYRIL